MTQDLPDSYEQLLQRFQGGGRVSVVIPHYTRRTFAGCVRRTDRLRTLYQGRGMLLHVAALLYLVYYELRLFIVTRGNRQLTAAALIYQLADGSISRIEETDLPSGDQKLTFIGAVDSPPV